ncbi:hypothetical protein [Bifidobacterium aquikefiricola]|uniref:Transposase n=1 Tax=Bifidobacterium aquikefiricola TaxID=3059038 RepID=A0AB39U6P7_9BIFI
MKAKSRHVNHVNTLHHNLNGFLTEFRGVSIYKASDKVPPAALVSYQS